MAATARAATGLMSPAELDFEAEGTAVLVPLPAPVVVAWVVPLVAAAAPVPVD